MQLIDTHCHLNFNAYDDMREEIIREATDWGVTRIIVPAIDLDSAHAVLALAEDHPGVYAAVGVHPNSTDALNTDTIDILRSMADHPKVVAIGEIGLDYYWDKVLRDVQWRAFEAQLALAAEVALPVIIHNREASDDVLSILASWSADLPDALQGRPGVLHSFSAPASAARLGEALGFYLGFTGPVTFKKADDLREIAASVPDERILVETDGPFLTPEPRRGRRPNRPAYVRYIAERLAMLRGVAEEVFARQTTANAERLFALPPIAET